MSRSVVVEVFSTKMNDWSAAPIHKLGGNVYCEIAEGQRYRVCAIDTTSRDAVIDLRVDGHHTGAYTKTSPAIFTGFVLDGATVYGGRIFFACNFGGFYSTVCD